MTLNNFSIYLSSEFPKWKGYLTRYSPNIEIRVKGTISCWQVYRMQETVIPMGVNVHFRTMGFWESLFCKNGTWTVK